MMFGNLTLEAFQHDFVQNMAVLGGVVNGILLIALITYLKRWKWLWNEWITTVDHKKIGMMYIVVVLIMFLKGFADAMMMRIQQATATGAANPFLTSEHFQEVFSAHGATMIFFVAMGFMFGIMNLIIPLQIGARDLAFPFLNAVSFWLFAAGGMLILISLGIGHFSVSGWLAYPPLSEVAYSPNEGVDYWAWSVQISGIGSTFSGINFLVTILKMRCPGMTLMKMPIFVWSSLCAMVLVIFAFPILTATVGLLMLDRYLGMHFFTASGGGNPMLYFNLIWAWGHPEVYILILPAFGIFSEVVPTFSEKRLFGYTSMVWAMVLIAFLSFLVWLHHFFTMGASPSVNTFFSVMTMLVAIPTGVKIFNWLFTKYRGKVHFTSPMLWFFSFVLNFSIAGMTGILLAAPPVDFQVHNSLFLIAHFHGMVIGGVLFGFFAGFTYWFPKYTGFFISERLNRWAFFCWFAGFLLAFMPLYMLGFMGATRRLDHYDPSTGWQPLFVIAAMGGVIIFIGALIQFVGLFWSIYKRKDNMDTTGGNPWNGRTLEWATHSPPPIYNFAVIPTINQRDPLWAEKPATEEKPEYEDIHLPANTPISFYIGALSMVLGFAMTWQIYWLGVLSFAGILGLIIARLSSKDEHFTISAEEVKKIEESYSKRQQIA
ncbi:Ubiquinol oxidase subunit 1 [Waddlia chondrophila 2032/99]|uniref:Cytochrome o ubiquinol oxidase, subunit I n=3 Tax=Waddlia chondrophila TaxID=71667 RepID=D6YUP8_WADCW|nr:cbb3-type cytochrome c oxidase subunit I [Waddlia chondrophila]ADI37859.1 cytochrome o ubiquinol oxidase, subunit I [Waddlia chondrophila WSU 86-1044]CCB92021.1 Ubiquinol oxidase subunit 1 [Waddlia chondrophila 2032/99]